MIRGRGSHAGRTVLAYLLFLAGAGRVIFGGSLAGNVCSSCLSNSIIQFPPLALFSGLDFSCHG
ncbi:hypothetical protein GGD61_005205 [Bradyrhizobium sp. SBR1B]|nr:hypothetical protein [Bradyrhizobium sp. SBR1B]